MTDEPFSPPPTCSRALGHSEFTRFLLELGLPDPNVGKEGNLTDRTTSLAEFAITLLI
jgi:hypothetical protein